jgi:hypothetical protein
MIAILFGLNHAGMGRFLAVEIGVIYWLGIFLPAWLVLDICSRLAAAVLRPWSPPLWLILLISSITAMIVLQPYAVWHSGLYAGLLPEGVRYEIVPPLPSLLGEWEQLTGYIGTPLFWIAINYYYDRVLDVPRYRGSLLEIMEAPRSAPAPSTAMNPESVRPITQNVAPPEAQAPPTPIDGFQRHIPLEIGRDIIALRAEDHYVRVHTMKGSALVRYRFSDALGEIAALDGIQVHRSCWVRRNAVKKLVDSGGSLALLLQNGLEVPVSRAYQKVVEQAGWR